LKPFKEIVEQQTKDENAKWYVHDNKIISAASILYDVLSANDRHLFYSSSQDIAEKYVSRLNKILANSSFDDWTRPEERKKEVKKLVEQLKTLIEQGSHGSSLMAKIAQEQGCSEEDIVIGAI
jgi:outer membrane lipopolysaccharide assembly protein LptE/RlpB